MSLIACSLLIVQNLDRYKLYYLSDIDIKRVRNTVISGYQTPQRRVSVEPVILPHELVKPLPGDILVKLYLGVRRLGDRLRFAGQVVRQRLIGKGFYRQRRSFDVFF